MLHLIERLEALVAEGTRIPLSGKAMVDEHEFLDIIDQLRVALPEELRQARRITQERDRILADAQTDADRLRQTARQQAAIMVDSTELAKSAQLRAEEIIDDAQRQAEQLLQEAEARAREISDSAELQANEVRSGAENYAREVMTHLEDELNQQISMVRNGLDMLEQDAQRERYRLAER